MQLFNHVLAVLALAMSATALPARDAALVAKRATLSARETCYGIPACCLGKRLMELTLCLLNPPSGCGAVADGVLCCPDVGAAPV